MQTHMMSVPYPHAVYLYRIATTHSDLWQRRLCVLIGLVALAGAVVGFSAVCKGHAASVGFALLLSTTLLVVGLPTLAAGVLPDRR